jgi:HlyD family secretion protein
MSASEMRLKKARADYKRNLKLHQQNVIADVELEAYKFELDRAANEVALTRKSRESQWQNELIGYERELRSIEAELEEIDREIRSMVVISPITGTVQRLQGIYPGSIVYTNQDVALISPDDNLIVEAYVSPGHIGLLQTGMKVRFLIDAFNYNQWGFGEGTVLEISNDIHLINDAPVFIIRCSLNRNYIQLKNGYKGILRKGMSLKARFIVTERTLWQLLYDKTDNWLNPGS